MSSAVNPDSGTDDRRRSGSAGTTPGGHQDLVARQKEQFGGMKFGCSFFGWLTATGTAVLLTALLAAIGAALNLRGIFGPQPVDSQNIRTVGLVSGIVLLVIVLVAYFAGGYVAARMARFSGLKQGLGVWLWAIIFAVVIAVIGFIAGDTANLLRSISGLQVPLNREALAGGGLIIVAAIVLIALVGALLGGLAGMRYHRKVDRAGFENG